MGALAIAHQTLGIIKTKSQEIINFESYVQSL